MENHHFQWENPLFLWPFSIAFCMFTSGYNLPGANQLRSEGPGRLSHFPKHPPKNIPIFGMMFP